jgi:hypothetical protein
MEAATKTQQSTDVNSSSAFDSADDKAILRNIRFMIIPIMISVLAIIVFLAGGLIAFFLLQQREIDDGYTGLLKISAEASSHFQSVSGC